MAELVWDATGARNFETGVDHGVLYPMDQNGAYPLGVAWNGLVSVTESPSGGEPTALYADNIKYLTLMSAEDFGLTVEAYTYPDEFAACDGSVEAENGVMVGQQARTKFGFVYRTKLGDDINGQDDGYLLHLIYGCLAAPSERSYQSVNESPEAITFSWEVSTTPVAVTGLKPTSCVIINSRTADATALAALEDTLFGTTGTPGTDPSLPLPDAVIAAMEPGA